MATDIERVCDPAYLDDLAGQPIDDIRAKRQECQDIENALSYVRRLLHGRLDIVRGELERRRQGGEPADLDAIIGRLPELLSDGSRSTGLPRPPQDLAPGGLAEQMVDELETKFPVSALASVPELSIDQLAELADGLSLHEGEVSTGRNELHRVIDELHEEIIRRYQSGEATVDSILQ